jgi:creatinine amidohydrolase
MPLGLDCLIAERLAWKACAVAESKQGFTCVIAPPLCYGFSPEWIGSPGTVSLPLEVFAGLIKAITVNLWRWGVERVIFLNAHGGNSLALRAALAEASALEPRQGKLVALIDYWRVAGLELGHASRLEASIAEGLGVKVESNESECNEAKIAGGGVYVYTTVRHGMESLAQASTEVDLGEVVEKVAGAIIKIVRADASKHWIG